MIHKYWNQFLILLFVLLSSGVWYGGEWYKSERHAELQQQQFETFADSLNKKCMTLIEEKENATLAIALGISENSDIKNAFDKNPKEVKSLLENISKKLSDETDFKNVWLQLVDGKGTSVARSWTDISGDNLARIRADVRQMLSAPQVRSTISVGHFDLSFKAMIPLYDNRGHFSGYLEVLTHFNSIAEKLDAEGIKTLILVDESYYPQLTKPFTKLFIGKNYVANRNVDPMVFKEVNDIGVSSFVSSTQKFLIDPSETHLVVNYHLYDVDNKPMAVFLLFKPLDSFDHSAYSNINLLVNASLLLIMLPMSLLFLFLTRRHTDSFAASSLTSRYILIFTLFFVIASLAFYQIVSIKQKNTRTDYLQLHNTSIQQDYATVYNNFALLTDAVYASLINRPEIMELMHRAYLSKEEKDLARKQLWEHLKNDYYQLKNYQVRQLHFHLSNNESFLRFHRPNRYGDNLTGIRPTIEWVNANHKKFDGFEEGRIFNGFRFVFPLKNAQYGYLGSVEISFNTYALISELAKSHDLKAGFLIDHKIVGQKVFSNEQDNYLPSPFKGFVYEREINQKLIQSSLFFNADKINPKDMETIGQRIKKGKLFTLISKDGFSLYTFVPLINPITREAVGTIIFEEFDPILKNQYLNFLLLIAIGLLFLLLATLFAYRETITKIRIRALLDNTQQILDAQHAIVIITDGKNITNANRTFLDFFGYPSLRDYQKDYDCICEQFVKDDHYFHTGLIPETVNWADHLYTLDEEKRIVLMLDSAGNPHSFMATLNRFENSQYVATFTDISKTVQAKKGLAEKVVRDKLTGAFNREFLESKFASIAENAMLHDKKLAVVLYDIDHFKRINDTYGHNVGDQILISLTALIRNTLRSDDYLIRWGGEEFIILMKVGNAAEADKVIESLRHRIEHHPFETIKQLTCSFGITFYHPSESVKKTIERADKGLYEAKSAGRNRIVLIS